MKYLLNENESQKIIKHFGSAFYTKVINDIQIYADKWNLEIISLIDYFSINCLFICYSTIYRDTVLKISRYSKETYHEFNVLREYQGHYFCRVFNADLENGVILEEYIKPGTCLRTEPLLSKRLDVFANIYNNLHIKPSSEVRYPYYHEWITNIEGYLLKKKDCSMLYDSIMEAKEIYLTLIKTYDRVCLLHGDLHHDNILLGANNEYKLIDPKGVLGDPIFDIARFMINEYDLYDKDSTMSLDEKMVYIVDRFSISLNLPKLVIKKCFFIDAVMTNCWKIEDSKIPNIRMIKKAKRMMLE